MKNFKAYLKEGIMSQYPELGPATGVSQDQVKADQKRTDRAKEMNRRETERQEKNVPSSSSKVPSPDEGPVNKKLKEGRADSAFDELEKEKEGKPVPVEPKRASEIQGKSTKVKNMNPLDREQWEKEKKEAQIKEEQLDEKLIRVRNVRSGAIRSVSSAFRKIYKKQGWNAVQGTRG